MRIENEMKKYEHIVECVDEYSIVKENGIIHVFNGNGDEFLSVKDVEKALKLPTNTFYYYFKKNQGQAETFAEDKDFLRGKGNLNKAVKKLTNSDNRGRDPLFIEITSAIMVIALSGTIHAVTAQRYLKNSSKLAKKIIEAYKNIGSSSALNVIQSYVNNLENIVANTNAYYDALNVLKKSKEPFSDDIRGLIKTTKAKNNGKGTSLTAEEAIEFQNIKLEKVEDQMKMLANDIAPLLKSL
jgi:predicted CopG family antitoxin